MLLYITGLQPTITKNTAVFHGNSVKYYHIKQAAAAPCSQQPCLREPGEKRAAKGLPTAEGEWATGLVNPWDASSSHPQLHSIRAQRTTARQQNAPTWAPAAEPSSRRESWCSLCTLPLAGVCLLPNLHFHVVLDSVKSPPSQLPCTNACVTRPPVTPSQQVLTVTQPEAPKAGIGIPCHYDGYHSPPQMVSSRSTTDPQKGRQRAHKFISDTLVDCYIQGWPAQRPVPPEQTENPKKQQVSPYAHWHALHTNE